MDSKKTIYFVRHGQSADSHRPFFKSLTAPLSEKGARQANSLADRLARVDFDALIASPIARAKETAEIVGAKTGHEVEFCDLFREHVKPVEIEGKPWDDPVADRVWHDWHESLYTPGSAHISNGENYDDILARVDQALDFLLKREESSIAIVTHGYILCAIIARVLTGDGLNGEIMRTFQKRAHLENTGVTILEYGDVLGDQDFRWHLKTFNDLSHFAE